MDQLVSERPVLSGRVVGHDSHSWRANEGRIALLSDLQEFEVVDVYATVVAEGSVN